MRHDSPRQANIRMLFLQYTSTQTNKCISTEAYLVYGEANLYTHLRIHLQVYAALVTRFGPNLGRMQMSGLHNFFRTPRTYRIPDTGVPKCLLGHNALQAFSELVVLSSSNRKRPQTGK